jgi:hypothetical protein
MTNDRIWSRFGQLVDDTHVVLNFISSWQIHHINRIANKAAHDLAKAVTKQFVNQVWIEEILEWICEIVLLKQFAQFFGLSYKSTKS